VHLHAALRSFSASNPLALHHGPPRPALRCYINISQSLERFLISRPFMHPKRKVSAVSNIQKV